MTDDRNISLADVQTLATRDGVAAFFAALGYGTDTRQPQSVSAMGITAGSLARQIEHIERIAVHDDGAEPLDTYLVELTSVTVAATQGLARALRNRVGNYLLVLTDDYERLDFVLLQRSLPGTPASPMTARQVSVRPRILTVNRRNPSQVQLRVLRRFTYTELDSDAQYDKLLSAYAVAEWSEPLFNNRALFSDYYLNERLPELDEWSERPEEAYHRLREELPQLRQQTGNTGDGASTRPPVGSALEALGFKTAVAGGGDEPDYRLYAPDNPEKPVAVCLAYSWNRYLDGRDETRDAQTPDENPGARVVTVLESGEAPWAIVTNGKLWRLYSARTHSRSTNYYEIDLQETLAMADPNEAFRYFWLFFRRSAFVIRGVQRDGQTRELSFLDRLLDESESYAKALGERLKDRVFERVFPHFAAGFIAHLKGQVGLAGPRQALFLSTSEQLALKREPDEDFRRQVFNGTLTLLYRLLFLLYAESRDLLPVKEVRGYWERSLTKMKEDIAERAGPIGDAAPDQLSKAYRASADATEMYDRLLDLFSVIDLGSRDLNVPLYNGGLFITKPASSDRTQEAETARFLASHKIPDRYLALGLDLLARDLDDKRQDLVFIDYKSLGVRQLGSIYEGLLEFKVRIAQEKMAVVKGKKTEEVIPYQETGKTKRKVLTIGRGRNAQERTYQPGDVYLENDRRERKASGSYYTPDHIVKYIVENTVGPVMAEKFDRLRPKFRDAQRDYRKAQERAEAFRRQGMKPDDPAKVANSYAGLVDDLFDLKVLDPAMGSGHFLVEAVDFICDRILGEREGFLRAFPWNPVTKFLQDTREAIIAEMERQGVAVDTGRLTDINLLKRHVLKRCAYGVDLNPMAVELSKVSLWLDCFTIGAPLSFLDHHLKCGNSLIGTSVQEIESELVKQTKGHAGTLFGGPFQGLLSATASIEQLRRIPDATVEEAERSHSLYVDFEKAQAPYKAALDIWVSQHFGNKLATELLTLTGDELVEDIRSGGKKLSPEYRDAIAKASEIGSAKHFFHWDLEFPEAFVDLERGTWKSQDNQGFDAVVGNPPYDVLATQELGFDVSAELSYFRVLPLYTAAARGKINLYKLFVCRAIGLNSREGGLAFITPMPLLGDDQARGIRQLILTSRELRTVESFPQKDDPNNRVFPEAKLSTTVFVVRGPYSGKVFSVRTHPVKTFDDQSPVLRIQPDQISLYDSENIAIPSCTQRDWDLVMKILSAGVVRMSAVANHYQGEVNETSHARFLTDDGEGPSVLRGAAVTMYAIREASQGRTLHLNPTAFLDGKPMSSKAWDHQQPRLGFQRKAPQNNFRRLISCLIPQGEFCFDSISYVPQKSAEVSLELLMLLLNSKILDWYFRIGSTNSSVNEYQFNNFPVLQVLGDPVDVFWEELVDEEKWNQLEEMILRQYCEPGLLPGSVATVLTRMCRRIQQIEARRTLRSRAERSHLAPDSQPIQDVIDKVLFRYYGLSDDDAEYIEKRLTEML